MRVSLTNNTKNKNHNGSCGFLFGLNLGYKSIPIQAYDARGNIVWECELDIYGKVRNLHGEKTFIPFRYQGQYEDIETGLYYNRFRYYSPDTGTYISKDPIGLAGDMPNMYSYVSDCNIWVDPFGTEQISFRAAFNQAKRDLGIPKNVNTPKPLKVFDSQYENRHVWAFEGENKGKFIIMHREDKFGRGQHLHTATLIDEKGNIHQSPLDKGRYNQHDGHIPENKKGFKGNVKGCK
ncbi:RHS repeat-associated core domain-containing protein [Tenacibaculum maritimum]|uniref:RHS repeat domain-containing protein n=2 Tax=Tenacibaculum maritimum TaxID=107401 RepID=UPI0038762029